MSKFLSLACLLVFVSACSTAYNPLDDYELIVPAKIPEGTVEASDYPPELVARGQYMATLLACGGCHTDGGIVGDPIENRYYAGSRTGIAYSNPYAGVSPGIVYPANLTPDVDTGIGSWSDAEIARAVKAGVNVHGRQQVPVMPWLAYQKINSEDTLAIVAFLRSLKPVRHEVPNNVSPGEKASSPYVHFGTYRSKDL